MYIFFYSLFFAASEYFDNIGVTNISIPYKILFWTRVDFSLKISLLLRHIFILKQKWGLRIRNWIIIGIGNVKSFLALFYLLFIYFYFISFWQVLQEIESISGCVHFHTKFLEKIMNLFTFQLWLRYTGLFRLGWQPIKIWISDREKGNENSSLAYSSNRTRYHGRIKYGGGNQNLECF